MFTSPSAEATVAAGPHPEPPIDSPQSPRLRLVPRGPDDAEVRSRLAARLVALRAEYRRQRERLIDATLCVDSRGAGALFGLSDRQWRHLSATDEVPAPRRLGGAVRWSLAELQAWLEAGCPNRETWEAR